MLSPADRKPRGNFVTVEGPVLGAPELLFTGPTQQAGIHYHSSARQALIISGRNVVEHQKGVWKNRRGRTRHGMLVELGPVVVGEGCCCGEVGLGPGQIGTGLK